MKKFKYSLENVLNVRETEKEQCRQKLTDAEKKVHNEQEAIDKLRATIDNYRRQASIGSPIEFLRNRETYLRRLDMERVEHLAAMNKLKKEEEKARLELIEASREVQKMEKVKDKEFKSWQLDAKREEQFLLDESGTARAHHRQHD